MPRELPAPPWPNREHERELHADVARFLRLALRPPTTWTTFPAGGGGLERGRMLARLGLRPGWPDILVLHPGSRATDDGRGAILVGLELKTESGRQSQAQQAVEAEFAPPAPATPCAARSTMCRTP